MWDCHEPYVAALDQTRQNAYLKGLTIPQTIHITADRAKTPAEVFVLALPSKMISTYVPQFAAHFERAAYIVNVSKGFEETQQLRISQYLRTLTDTPVVILTGPSHAEEVVKNVPTALVAAAEDPKVAEAAQALFSSECFRVYTSTDVVGAELGGALKNVIALAAGCCDGLGFGDNTKAALVTRGMAEITRLGVAMGAREQTFSGLSGIGDLFVTCTSQHSRNYRAGRLIAEGLGVPAVLERIGMVVEGITTARAALALSQKHGVSMPLVEAINRVLFDAADPKTTVMQLMVRASKNEYIAMS